MITLQLKDLASRGFGSNLPEGTEILIKRFNLSSLTLCNESIETGNYQTFVDAVNEHVSVDVEVLSIRDFFQIVAAIRCMTFQTSPINMSWNCAGIMFKQSETFASPSEVLDLIQLDAESDEDTAEWKPVPCGTSNSIDIKFEDLEVIYLPEDIDLDPRLDIPRTNLLAEYRRLCAEPRYTRIIPAVAWLKEGDTLEDKLAILHDDMDLYDLCSRMASKYPHGLVSKIKSSCVRCDTTVAQPLFIDNTSFLRKLS